MLIALALSSAGCSRQEYSPDRFKEENVAHISVTIGGGERVEVTSNEEKAILRILREAKPVRPPRVEEQGIGNIRIVHCDGAVTSVGVGEGTLHIDGGFLESDGRLWAIMEAIEARIPNQKREQETRDEPGG